MKFQQLITYAFLIDLSRTSEQVVRLRPLSVVSFKTILGISAHIYPALGYRLRWGGADVTPSRSIPDVPNTRSSTFCSSARTHLPILFYTSSITLLGSSLDPPSSTPFAPHPPLALPAAPLLYHLLVLFPSFQPFPKPLNTDFRTFPLRLHRK